MYSIIKTEGNMRGEILMFATRIRRGYRLKSRKKDRIRYEDALEALKTYENGELRIRTVIDNHYFKGFASNCQVPGCNQHIRYEYVMENKESGDKLIAGSTCVWILLGLSEEQIKTFKRVEKGIKNYHKVLEWERENYDVKKALDELKSNRVVFFKPFWEEIEFEPLDEEDTEYIRNIIPRLRELIVKSRISVGTAKSSVYANSEKKVQLPEQVPVVKIIKPVPVKSADYDDVVRYLEKLAVKFPSNRFYSSLLEWIDGGKVLTPAQLNCVRRDAVKV